MICETILGQRDCPCVHETCTDGRVCDHMEPDTAGPEGARVERPLTAAELAERHDMGE